MAFPFPTELHRSTIHLVGIKGTGMTALAELLSEKGAILSGSDVPEKFFTDEILDRLRIPYSEEFRAENVPSNVDLVIHSAAYFPDSNPELIEARRRGVVTMTYTQALGAYSQRFEPPYGGAAGIAGVHGKTTTTAMTGVAMKALELPFTVLAGSLVPDFDQRATMTRGEKYFVAETCEYKRHFLSFHPSQILVTSVELDHTDYFRDYADIFDAFLTYVERLSPNGTLVFCADEQGALELADRASVKRPDLDLVGYGFEAEGPFRIVKSTTTPGRNAFRLAGWKTELALSIPGRHNVLNAAGAIALASTFWKKEHGSPLTEDRIADVCRALETFRGSRRRSQIVGTTRGILVMDDYAHHPTAIETTLRGLKEFYPDRRLVVDFMSHTYSRTKSLLNEFAQSLTVADEIVLHKIYASARETDTLGIDGKTLFETTKTLHPNVRYYEEPLDALEDLRSHLYSGDLFVTMGAGDNWKLGIAFLESSEGGDA